MEKEKKNLPEKRWLRGDEILVFEYINKLNNVDDSKLFEFQPE